MRHRKAIRYFTSAILFALVVVGSAGTAGASTKRLNFLDAYRATTATSAKETLSEVITSGATHETVSGSGEADAHGNGAFTLQGAGESIGTVIDNGVLYAKVPASSAAELHVSTPWVSLNLDAVTKAKLGESYQQLASDGQQGPAESLAILRSASSSGVQYVGKATLFGADTTEYRTTVALSKVATASHRPALAPAIENLETNYHVTSIPLEVWVDGQQRVRRLVENVKVQPSTAPAVSATITVNIVAFGVPVDSTPPPAADVTDITAQATGSGPS